MEEEGFFQIKTTLKQFRNNLEIQDDGNNGYYAIISQANPNLYGTNTFGPHSKIPDYIKKVN
jgi:hypothetical protein